MSIQTIKNTKDLSRLLKARREELGISQSELAQLCNLSLNGISKLESNKDGTREVKLSTLFKLSKFLGFELALKVEE
jgi:transcriptional regulator with XRE-family HTH domain